MAEKAEPPAESVATAQAEPLPSDVETIECLAYVMACLSGVIHPDVMDRLRVVWKYVKGHTDEP